MTEPTSLTDKLSLIKQRKAVIIPQLKQLEFEVGKHALEESQYTSLDAIEVLATEALTFYTWDYCIEQFQRILDVLNEKALPEAELAKKRSVIRKLLFELKGLNEHEKSLNIQYKNSFEQLLIKELKQTLGAEKFKEVCEQVKKKYESKTVTG
jgi:hypothetical protein